MDDSGDGSSKMMCVKLLHRAMALYGLLHQQWSKKVPAEVGHVGQSTGGDWVGVAKPWHRVGQES